MFFHILEFLGMFFVAALIVFKFLVDILPQISENVYFMRIVIGIFIAFFWYIFIISLIGIFKGFW